ncbi:MAG: hypothetical protein LBO63_04640 [Oscillospiraceae bacterium]|jgi:stage III sporulation protein AG|nr:hypothetical protein [Oscillospiraceae bacterium]
MKKYVEKIKTLFKSKKISGAVIIVLFAVLGLVFLLLPTEKSNPPPSAAASGEKAQGDTAYSVTAEENRIAVLLSKIAGAGRVDVMLTLKSGGLTELATDSKYSEKQSGGALSEVDEAETTVVVQDANRGEGPVIVRQGMPEYMGALVVCQGADSPEVRLAITNAIASLTGLPKNKITVAKMS